MPDSVTNRKYHSLSVWSETPTTNWIIEFGGSRYGSSYLSDTRFIEISEYMYTLVDTMCINNRMIEGCGFMCDCTRPQNKINYFYCIALKF